MFKDGQFKYLPLKEVQQQDHLLRDLDPYYLIPAAYAISKK